MARVGGRLQSTDARLEERAKEVGGKEGRNALMSV